MKATQQNGTDCNGEWTPSQYALDAGWDHTCIEATAKFGASEVDAEGLTKDQQSALLEWCKERVEAANQ